MQEQIKELERIHFDVASADEIRNKSVYHAYVSKYTDNKRNTIYDHRGGSIFNKKCETCKQYEQQCPGHFGHIELNAIIVHPIFFFHVFNILKIICHVCSKLLISREHLEFNNILKLTGEKRILEIINKVKKFNKCFHCNSIKREYKIKKDPTYNIILYNDNIELSDDNIKQIFDDIDSETLSLLNIAHPSNFCLEVFPVIPPCCRPYEIVGNAIKEDDLTKQLIEIIKANNSLKTLTTTAENTSAAIHNLKLKIETYCRNPKKKVRNINNDLIKGIRERLTGKDGQLRNNLMGKRTEMSARTVIGPGPHLRVDEVGIPESIAKNITFPINVYNHNIEYVKKLIKIGLVEKIKRNDKIIRIDLKMFEKINKFLKIGDVVIRNNSRVVVDNLKFQLYENDRIIRNNVDITPPQIPKILEPEIVIGDIAQRRIIDGDWVLMNRQPTLWKGSMMAFKAVISKTNTFTFNLAVCKAFNSDFDGDEQNAHFPQSLQSSIEIRLLSRPEECLLSSSNGTPVIVVLQDALLGAYLMCISENFIIDNNDYNDIIECLTNSFDYYLKRKYEIENTLKSLNLYKNKSTLNKGRYLLSLLLPGDFHLIADDLKIKNGCIYEGFLSKKYLSSTSTSLIKTLKTEYNDEVSMRFINDIYFMTNKWLTHHSFSINMDDCLNQNVVDLNIADKLEEADFVRKTILNPILAEARTNIILSNAKDVGIKIAETSENNMIHTIKSGSKGDYFNLGQVNGMVGQQLINGSRIQKKIGNGTRTLIHYPKTELSLLEDFESRGLIINNFSRGLNAREFAFHSMSGRQGVCDTAMTTHSAGYSMRRLIKTTEDTKVDNDGIVSDSSGNIYNWAYGDNGFNPEYKHIDIERIINKFCQEPV